MGKNPIRIDKEEEAYKGHQEISRKILICGIRKPCHDTMMP